MKVTIPIFIATIISSSQAAIVYFRFAGDKSNSSPLCHQCGDILVENGAIPVTLSTNFIGSHLTDGESIAVLGYRKLAVAEDHEFSIGGAIHHRCDNQAIEEGYCEADEKDHLLYSLTNTESRRCTKEDVKSENCSQNDLGKYLGQPKWISGIYSAVLSDSKDYGQIMTINVTGTYCFKADFNTTIKAAITFDIKDNDALHRKLIRAKFYVYLIDFILHSIGSLIFVGVWLLWSGLRIRKIPFLIRILMGTKSLSVVISGGLLLWEVKNERQPWIYFFGPANRLVLTLIAFLYSSNFTFDAVPLDKSTVFCIILVILRRGAFRFVDGHKAEELGIDYYLWYNIGNELGKYETWLERGIIPCWILLRYYRKIRYYSANNNITDSMFRAFRLWIPCFVASVTLVLFKPILKVIIFYIIENFRFFESRCFIDHNVNMCVRVPQQIFSAVYCLLTLYPLICHFLPRTYVDRSIKLEERAD